MGWFYIEIESRDFNRSGSKAELIYTSQQMLIHEMIRSFLCKICHGLSYNIPFFMPGA